MKMANKPPMYIESTESCIATAIDYLKLPIKILWILHKLATLNSIESGPVVCAMRTIRRKTKSWIPDILILLVVLIFFS